MCYYIIFILLFFNYCGVIPVDNKQLPEDSMITENENVIANSNQHVAKKILSNGLTVLVHESHTIPKVSFQMWYNVGSKDELLSEKGIAHLIEHMIFKGTDM